MKKLTTLLTTAAVVLMTGTFAIAQATAAPIEAFPYFQLGCLMVGGLVIVGLKNKYKRIFTSEAIGTFALYTLLVSLFTNPVIDAIKTLVSA